MAVCADYRISHSHYLGGPAVWTAADRDKAAWWQRQQAEICSTCGTAPWQWDPAQGGHRRAFVATETVCAGCEVIERAEAQIPEDEPRLRGSRLGLTPREETGRAQDQRAAAGHPRGTGAVGSGG